jgi:hypothetical protein
VDERLTRRAQPLLVLGHASVVRDPREGALRAIHLLGRFSKAGRVGNLFLRRRHRLYESRPALRKPSSRPWVTAAAALGSGMDSWAWDQAVVVVAMLTNVGERPFHELR